MLPFKFKERESYRQQEKQYTKQYRNTEYTKHKTNIQNRKTNKKRILKTMSRVHRK
jgi:hypothetical protein